MLAHCSHMWQTQSCLVPKVHWSASFIIAAERKQRAAHFADCPCYEYLPLIYTWVKRSAALICDQESCDILQLRAPLKTDRALPLTPQISISQWCFLCVCAAYLGVVHDRYQHSVFSYWLGSPCGAGRHVESISVRYVIPVWLVSGIMIHMSSNHVV